jgi:hypothetical protein
MNRENLQPPLQESQFVMLVYALPSRRAVAVKAYHYRNERGDTV